MVQQEPVTSAVVQQEPVITAVNEQGTTLNHVAQGFVEEKRKRIIILHSGVILSLDILTQLRQRLLSS